MEMSLLTEYGPLGVISAIELSAIVWLTKNVLQCTKEKAEAKAWRKHHEEYHKNGHNH